MLTERDDKPVHFPANPQKFEFDSEVSKIFPNMAERSIPNFLMAHKMHVRMARDWLQEGSTVLDIGASRGAFYAEILRQGHKPESIDYTAVDNSGPMCALLKADYPQAQVLHMDITTPEFASLCNVKSFDVVCCNYVLQFLPEREQFMALQNLTNALRPGGLLFLGHKHRHYGRLGELSHDFYIDWRVENGYTREEVIAKTEALKGSMFPMNHGAVFAFLRSQYSEVIETTRLAVFSTMAAKKK